MIDCMNDTLVIDVETKKSFAEVGGERNIRQLGISIAGVYSYGKNQFFAFEERELDRLEALVRSAHHIIGFNINHFDIPVMEAYLPEGAFSHVQITDIYADAVAFLGHRVGLGALGKATLGVGKSGNGLEALQWFREGKIEQIKTYCLDDVKITRDLYEYGKQRGHVLFESFVDRKIHSIPVAWDGPADTPAAALKAAFEERRRIRIDYVSSEDSDGLGYKKSRLIDIYAMNQKEIEAYCHLRNAVRNFHINRIMKAEVTDEIYILPQDTQPALFAL